MFKFKKITWKKLQIGFTIVQSNQKICFEVGLSAFKRLCDYKNEIYHSIGFSLTLGFFVWIQLEIEIRLNKTCDCETLYVSK